MGRNMGVCVGTWEPTDLVIDIDDYAECAERGTTEDEEVRAMELLDCVLNEGVRFANAGNRNYGAVNSCIALHVLGYDPVKWFDNFFADEKVNNLFLNVSIFLFKEHVERVADYLDYWGPKGNEGRALDFAL